MLYNKFSDLYLYVPFNHEYSVPVELQKKLTEEEFFEHCYYDPKFEKVICEFELLNNEECTDLEYPLDIKQIITKIQKQKNERNLFFSWIKNNDVGIYFITGDAGTGKSTFLRSLSYKKHENCKWTFLDLQAATNPIKIMNFQINFPKFNSLYQKLLSIIISEIVKMIYIKKDSSVLFDYHKTKNNIKNLLDNFTNNIEELYPAQQVSFLYNKLKDVQKELDCKAYCLRCAEIIHGYFQALCNKIDDFSSSFSVVLEHLLILSYYYNSQTKNILIFDNIERFISTHEIYTDEICVFSRELRRIHDYYQNVYKKSNSNESIFAKYFQFVIAMRHTTTRMFTPQQNSDFIEHNLNISDWFSIEKIVSLKEKWLYDNNFIHESNKRLNDILNDLGLNGVTLRGLRLKLNLLFNNNKRLILDFLMTTLDDIQNKSMFELAELFMTNENLPTNLKKYAYRSIIWRLVIDKLLNDQLFHEFVNIRDVFEKKVALDYIRKILTILYNYSQETTYSYMSLTDLLKQLYPDQDNVSQWFCSEICKQERERICRLLYFMNYYDRRDNNWFQFVDIQCNSQIKNKETNVINPLIFSMIITDHGINTDDIRLQITTSGKTYLGYIAQTFEFISSIYNNNPVLMTAIPKRDDLISKPVEELECYMIINSVANMSNNLCNEVEFALKTRHDIKNSWYCESMSYADLIKRSHIGYIDNFCNCVKKIYSYDLEIKEKIDMLISKIQEIRNTYL